MTVEEIDVPDHAAAKGSVRDQDLERLREDYAARRITQPEFSAAYVDLLERYDEEDVDGRPKERVLGRLKGLIEIMPGFDDPIEGLEWAYP